MKAEGTDGRDMTRREVLKHALEAGTALAVPWIVPARALGKANVAAASERITLG